MVDPSEPGTWTTIGYVVAYNSRARVKGAVEEVEQPYGTAAAAEPEPFELDPPEPVENGAGDLEAAEALRADS